MIRLNKQIVWHLRTEEGGDETFGLNYSYGIVSPLPAEDEEDDQVYLTNWLIHQGPWSTTRSWNDDKKPRYMPKFGAGRQHGF